METGVPNFNKHPETLNAGAQRQLMTKLEKSIQVRHHGLTMPFSIPQHSSTHKMLLHQAQAEEKEYCYVPVPT